MYSFVFLSPGGQLFPDRGGMVRAAPHAGTLGAGEGRILAAVALDQDALGTPPVDLAELHLLDLVIPFDVPDYDHRLLSFPSPWFRTGRSQLPSCRHPNGDRSPKTGGVREP